MGSNTATVEYLKGSHLSRMALSEAKDTAWFVSQKLTQSPLIAWVYECWYEPGETNRAAYIVRFTDRAESRVDGMHLVPVAAFRNGIRLTLDDSIVGAH